MADIESLMQLLRETPSGDASSSEAGTSGSPPAPPPEPPSNTVLKVDKWGKRRADALSKADWHQEGSDPTVWDINELADAHTACYESKPAPADDPADKVRAKWYEHLLESPDFKGMHSRTRLHRNFSEIGAIRIAGQYQQYLDGLDDQDREGIERGNPDGTSTQDDFDRIRTVAQAVNEASGDVSEAHDASSALGFGSEDGPDTGTGSGEIVTLFKTLRDNDILRTICKLAGRYRRVAQSQQRRKCIHGKDDVVGIHLDGEVSRLIPSEIAALCMPLLQLDALRRISERQAMCRQYRGIEPVGKGPIVICVDESGSMDKQEVHGNPLTQRLANAKAFALSMGWVAQHQNRWIAFVSFSNRRQGHYIAFEPRKWDQAKLMEWLEHFYAGGTSLLTPIVNLPYEWWPEIGAPKGKTDMVIITDGILNCNTDDAERYNAWKDAEEVKCHGIVLGTDNHTGELEQVCDRIWAVNTLDHQQECVEELLGI